MAISVGKGPHYSPNQVNSLRIGTMLPPKELIRQVLLEAAAGLGLAPEEIAIKETPAGKSGDYGSPLAFSLAKTLRRPPAAIASELAARIPPTPEIKNVSSEGGYLNFHLEPNYLLAAALEPWPAPTEIPGKIILEHTSVNPNKELHVGHLRNVVLGDALARILRQTGHQVEVINYIDDTGRQAAESLFGLARYQEPYTGELKYDHWVGQAYVRLHQELEDPATKTELEPAILQTVARAERGELRPDVEKILAAQLETLAEFGTRYDALVFESDLIQAGLVEKALAILKQSPLVHQPQEGKYAGAWVMDTEAISAGMNDPYLVLVRSDGSTTYPAKDIAFQFWKMGLLGGLHFRPHEGIYNYASSPEGAEMALGGAEKTINVIDVRQSYPQQVVRAALAVAGHPELAQGAEHLAYETVLLEGRTISGRKGHTVSADAVIEEAIQRALAVVLAKNPNHPDPTSVAWAVGIGAVRFTLVKSEPKRQIDFRFEEALSMEGDAAPYLQYAHARACSILRKAEAGQNPDWQLATTHDLELAKALLAFPESLANAAKSRGPHILAQQLLDFAAGWNSYYNAKTPEGNPATQVLGAPGGLQDLRLALVDKVRQTLALGLGLLGIEAPESM